MGAGWEQHPGHRQVAGRVARGDVAEVDHPADLAVIYENVRRVQVAVQPEGRAVVAGDREHRVPHAEHRVPVEEILAAGEQGEVGREAAGALASGTPRKGLAGASAGAGTCSAPRNSPTAAAAAAGSKELACAAGTPGR